MEQIVSNRFTACGSEVEGGDARTFVFHMSTVEGGKAPENTLNTKSDEFKRTSDVSGFSSF